MAGLRSCGPPVHRLTGVMGLVSLTPMSMVKTQVYFSENDLKALHAVAKKRKRPVAELVREAVQQVWLRPAPRGPVGLFRGKLSRGSSVDHDWVFDDR